MMLKLRGHPPIMMRKTDEEQAQFSSTFTKVGCWTERAVWLVAVRAAGGLLWL